MQKYENFDQVIAKVVSKKKPMVIDIGANKGQSIDIFRRLYPECYIHAFEPVKFEFNKLLINYKKKIIINNIGVGHKNTSLDFYTTKGSANSSFLKYKNGSAWLKDRARYWNTISRKFIINKAKKKIVTLDFYCKKNNINFIDILKIDTEGFEEKVLLGARNLIKKNKIKLILIEITFANHQGQDLSFYNIEKHLIKYGYRIHAISTPGFACRFNLGFVCDVIYVC